MGKKSSAQRFAKAVFELVGRKYIDDTKAELIKVSDLGRDVHIVTYLDNPKVNFKSKTSILSEKIGDISDIVTHLVYLLIMKGQMSMLPDIVDEYEHMVDEFYGIERADIITAIPIDDKAREIINLKLSNITGKKVFIETEKVDPDLIGGIKIKVAGKLIDGSTQGRLTKLKKELI